MTDPNHRHPATVAFERFKNDPAYVDLFCHRTPSELARDQRLFEEGWLSRDVPPAKDEDSSRGGSFPESAHGDLPRRKDGLSGR